MVDECVMLGLGRLETFGAVYNHIRGQPFQIFERRGGGGGVGFFEKKNSCKPRSPKKILQQLVNEKKISCIIF